MPQLSDRVWLFDLDGTLVDSVDLIMNSFVHAMNTHRGHADKPELFQQTIGRPLREQFSQYSSDTKEVEKLIETYSVFYRANRKQAQLFDGTRELLETLKNRNSPMAIVTSKSHIGAVRTVDSLNISNYFELLIGADDVKHGKPHPEPLFKALAHFGVGAEEALFIGDSPHDMEAARSANVLGIGVSWGPYSEKQLMDAGAEFVVNSMSELLDA